MELLNLIFFKQNQNRTALIAAALTALSVLYFPTRARTQITHNNNKFTVEGTIRHFGNGLLIGSVTDSSRRSIRLDTIIIINDSFKHEGWVGEKQIVKYKAIDDRFAKYRNLVKGNDTVRIDLAEDKSRSLEIVVSAGSHIKVSGMASTYLEAYPFNTDENQQLAELNQTLYPLYNEIGELKTQYSKQTYDSLLRRENTLLGQMDNIAAEFIKEHPWSIVSSSIVLEKFKALNEKDPIKADSIAGILRPSVEDIYYRQIIALKEARTADDVAIAVGDLFPSFQTKLVYSGSDFNSGQVRGKYTLIDFWGSWCVPCVKEMPKLKEYYKKFKEKLNVVGIANDKPENWKAFLDKNNYPWIQILDQEIPKLSDRLKVRVYPTKYLLDSDGKVIMIFIDSNDEVWKALDDLFKLS